MDYRDMDFNAPNVQYTCSDPSITYPSRIRQMIQRFIISQKTEGYKSAETDMQMFLSIVSEGGEKRFNIFQFIFYKELYGLMGREFMSGIINYLLMLWFLISALFSTISPIYLSGRIFLWCSFVALFINQFRVHRKISGYQDVLKAYHNWLCYSMR